MKRNKMTVLGKLWLKSWTIFFLWFWGPYIDLSGYGCGQAAVASPASLPFHANLKGAKVYWREGPSYEHPVLWTYQCSGWPVIILKKCFHWYYVQDCEGVRGWVHTRMLSFKRSVYIQNDMTPLKNKPNDHGKVVAFLKKGVIGKMLKEKKRWFFLEVGQYKGWVFSQNCWNPSKK
jgi:SH3-like domain-containing protein